jgi:hypothetical protein
LLKNHLQQQMFYVVFKFTTVSELQSINLDWASIILFVDFSKCKQLVLT